MIVFPLANANASVISVTGTATALLKLIDTAGATNHAFRQNLDAVNITPEDGDIRVIFDNSTAALAPTSTKGFIVRKGASFFSRFQPLYGIKIISTTGTVSCSVQIGTSELGECSVLASGERVAEAYVDQLVDQTNALGQMAIKPLAVSTYSWSLFQNLGANATLNVKATPGNVRSIYCHNINAAARWIQVHNTATTPGGGAVPLLTFYVPATSAIFIGADILGDHGVNFSTGIAFAFSTTEATYTAGTATDQFTHILYK